MRFRDPALVARLDLVDAADYYLTAPGRYAPHSPEDLAHQTAAPATKGVMFAIVREPHREPVSVG